MRTDSAPVEVCIPIEGVFNSRDVKVMLDTGEIVRTSVRLVGEEAVMRALECGAEPTLVDAFSSPVFSCAITIRTDVSRPDADFPHLVLRCNRHFCLLVPIGIDADGLFVAGRVLLLARGWDGFFYGCAHPTTDRDDVFGKGARLTPRIDVGEICAEVERRLRALPDAPRSLATDEALERMLHPPLAHGATREHLDAILRAFVTTAFCEDAQADETRVARVVVEVGYETGKRRYAVDVRKGLRPSTDPAAPALREAIGLVLSHYAPNGFSNDATLFKLGLVCTGFPGTIFMYEPSDYLQWTDRARSVTALDLARAHALVHDTIGDIATRDEACARRLTALLRSTPAAA